MNIFIFTVESLRLAMLFISACFEMKSKFMPANKEASERKFNSSLLENLPRLEPLTGSTMFSSWLCLEIFMRLLKQISEKGQVETPTIVKHDCRDDDIVIYVGGSIVSKLRKAAHRLTDGEKDAHLEVLSHLVSSKEDSNDAETSLTNVLDRGGLVRLVPKVQAMFLEMENLFLNLFSDTHLTCLPLEMYSQECLKNDTVLCAFYECTYESTNSDTVKFHLMKGIIALYFRIRAYHKCRSYMDHYCYAKCITRKQKALRKTLKLKE